MDRRRAHERLLDGRNDGGMYAIHGEESVLANPDNFGLEQFRGLRKVIKLMLARERYQTTAL